MSCDKYYRMIIKRASGLPTVPASADHRDGSWILTDIYEGELYQDTDTGRLYTRQGGAIVDGTSANFANTDLTFTGNRSHNTNGSGLEITTDNGVYAESYLFISPTQTQLGTGLCRVTTAATSVDLVANNSLVARASDTGVFSTFYAVRKAYAAVTATLTLDDTHHIVDCTANTFTVNLPSATTAIQIEYTIKNSGTGIITVDGSGAETIDGSLTQILSQYDSMTIISTGTNWIII